MARADGIWTALDEVSLHLDAINLLGDVLSSVVDQGGARTYQYDFCIAFRLLAQAAQGKLDQAFVEGQRVGEDLNAVSCETGRAA